MFERYIAMWVAAKGPKVGEEAARLEGYSRLSLQESWAAGMAALGLGVWAGLGGGSVLWALTVVAFCVMLAFGFRAVMFGRRSTKAARAYKASLANRASPPKAKR